MLRLTFGVEVDMRGDGSFEPSLDLLLGSVDPADVTLKSNGLVVRTATGATIVLAGHYDRSSEQAFLASRITGVSVGKPGGGLVFSAMGLEPVTLAQADASGAAVDRALVRAAARGTVMFGSRYGDVLVGLAGPDSMHGGHGADTLRGGRGVDVLHGDDGNDLLDGGPGADFLYGDGGQDTFVVDNVHDHVSAQGRDLVKASVSFTLTGLAEGLQLTGAHAIDGGGNGRDNRLTGNLSSNVLRGFAGNDSLDGGAGADRMEGGRGDDTYRVAEAGDRVVERTNEGHDTVLSRVDFTLPPAVEDLQLLGSGALRGTGNAGANRLVGAAGNNHLDGAGGDDLLFGGMGRDVLTGGEGADSFVFAHGGDGNVDEITDFLSGTDSLWLNPAMFSALTDGAPVTSEMRLATDVADGNDFLVYDPASGRLAYDATGNGGTLLAIADLGAGTTLLAGDIQVGVV